ncbi:hypothetical protein B0H19DRAFT_1250267 [Mycena capillaripes]|nr:hypothetical protein B0H19DRAFT_1250267 [Mycena capillaripes]
MWGPYTLTHARQSDISTTIVHTAWVFVVDPNDTLRYAALGLVASLGLIYAMHLKRPSVQLGRLDAALKTTEAIIQEARAHCPRDFLSLTDARVRLLEIKRSTSMIQCRLLETNTFNWKKYRLLSRDIADCAKYAKKIRTTVQLIIEAERQRKFTEDINATEISLTSARYPGSGIPGYQANVFART